MWRNRYVQCRYTRYFYWSSRAYLLLLTKVYEHDGFTCSFLNFLLLRISEFENCLLRKVWYWNHKKARRISKPKLFLIKCNTCIPTSNHGSRQSMSLSNACVKVNGATFDLMQQNFIRRLNPLSHFAVLLSN